MGSSACVKSGKSKRTTIVAILCNFIIKPFNIILIIINFFKQHGVISALEKQIDEMGYAH